MPPRQTTTEAVEPATLETIGVAFLLALVATMRGVNGHRLLFARVNWENLFMSASPPGAPVPSVAKGSYTRQALRRHHDRRVALRSGKAGLLNAIRAA